MRVRVRVRVRVRGLHPAGGLAADLEVEIYARVVGAARLLERHAPPLGVAAGRLDAAAPRLVEDVGREGRAEAEQQQPSQPRRLLGVGGEHLVRVRVRVRVRV